MLHDGRKRNGAGRLRDQPCLCCDLSIHLGTPPTTFDWQWHDKNDKFHRDANMTPKRFAKKYVSAPLNDYVCLVHDPRTSSPVGRTFTVEYLGNVVGGKPVVYLNVEMPLLRRVARRTLGDGEPVWFGCDTPKQMDRDMGLWDVRLQDYESIYQTDFALDKATRLEYGATAMNHAMVFTGVDLKSGKPRRWRVENSWGCSPLNSAGMIDSVNAGKIVEIEIKQTLSDGSAGGSPR